MSTQQDLPRTASAPGEGLFGRLVAGLLGTRASAEGPRRDPGPLETAESELEEAVEGIRARADRIAAASEQGSGDAASGGGGTRRVERLRAERDRQRDRLAGEILDLHRRLATGLGDRDALERLGRMLDVHVPAGAHEAPTIAERVERHTLRRLYREAGNMAWRRLERLMEEAGVAWPVPDDLRAGRSEEALAAILVQRREEMARWFLRMPPGDTAALIVGEVPAWKLAYPDPARARWRETALRAVAAGIRAQVYVAAIETWLWRPPELERSITAVLDERLSESRGLLAGGFSSLEAASQVMQDVEQACSQLVPERVWGFVRPRLAWSESDGVTAPIGVLAEGLAMIDPVCGMALRSELAPERTTWQGRTYFFCTRACRDRFRSNPQGFVERGPAEGEEGR